MMRAKWKSSGDLGKPFKIMLTHAMFKKGDILSYGQGNVIVSKHYKRTWWKKILRVFGFKFECFNNEYSWYQVKAIND